MSSTGNIDTDMYTYMNWKFPGTNASTRTTRTFQNCASGDFVSKSIKSLPGISGLNSAYSPGPSMVSSGE